MRTTRMSVTVVRATHANNKLKKWVIRDNKSTLSGLSKLVGGVRTSELVRRFSYDTCKDR